MVGTFIVDNVVEDVVPRVVVWKLLVLWVVDVIVVIMDALVIIVVVCVVKTVGARVNEFVPD